MNNEHFINYMDDSSKMQLQTNVIVNNVVVEEIDDDVDDDVFIHDFWTQTP